MTLRDYLNKTGTTASAFADLVGVKHSSVSRWAAGETRPDWRRLDRIEAATNGAVTAADFIPRPVQQASA